MGSFLYALAGFGLACTGMFLAWAQRQRQAQAREHDQRIEELKGLRAALDKALNQAKRDEGPFYSASIKFPRRMKQFRLSGELVREMHVHKLTPRDAIHLTHVLKETCENLPRSAMLMAAGMDINQDIWSLTYSDDSFPEVEPGEQVPTENLINHRDVRVRMQTECPACIMDAIGNTKTKSMTETIGGRNLTAP